LNRQFLNSNYENNWTTVLSKQNLNKKYENAIVFVLNFFLLSIRLHDEVKMNIKEHIFHDCYEYMNT